MKILIVRWTPFNEYERWGQEIDALLENAVVELNEHTVGNCNLLKSYEAVIRIPETEEHKETVFHVQKTDQVYIRAVINGVDKTRGYRKTSIVLGGLFPFRFNPYKTLCEVLDSFVQDFAQPAF